MNVKHEPKFFKQWAEKQHELEPHLNISVVVPAFNEELRLPPTLIDMIDYFDTKGETYEIIVVDDGSSDNTGAIVKKFTKIRPHVKLITLPENCGKGRAVRTGALRALGHTILLADADGSTPIEELERLQKVMEQGRDIAIGSRAMASTETRIVTKWYRKVLGRIFNRCVNIILLPGIADTQCGFKLFSAPAAAYIFSTQKSNRFSFDIELLYIARKTDLTVAEIPINWVNIPGSKVNLLVDAFKMFCDIFLFKIQHRKLTPTDYQRFLGQAD
ncbi:glycosyltransferase family 2 protein [Oligoflexia bacterium]|nr:glycosyltransferase family 2 protein [Oligoflexia bacterium]